MNPNPTRLPSPAMLVACAAFVVSLGGVGYAAGVVPAHSVGAKQLRRAAVVPSKVAPSTIALFKGHKGDPGATGPTGDTGPKGDTGPAGPFPGSLPSGATLRGAYNVSGDAALSGASERSAISFGFTLKSAPVAHFVGLGETGGSDCPGIESAPQAAPGQLCIYEAITISATPVAVLRVRPYGAVLTATSTDSGLWGSNGSWAVTAG